jgi:predicted alpha-1,2-mannosidase
MNGRYAHGGWYQPFDPDEKHSFITEGTPRHYSFFVPHDVEGLTALMGGKKALENALDSLFLKEQYWHGNEPCHAIPFLYNYTDSPWKTQKVVHDIMQEEYDNGTGGLSGNDDAGQMSAWYVFAAIGLYPVDPVSDRYQLTAPHFDEVVLQMPDSKQFRMKVKRKTPGAIYIESVKLNGVPYHKRYLLHSDLAKGGTLEFILTETPGKTRKKLK